MKVSLFSPSWWLHMFMSTIIIMVFIYLIKKAANKVNIPGLTNLAAEV